MADAFTKFREAWGELVRSATWAVGQKLGGEARRLKADRWRAQSEADRFRRAAHEAQAEIIRMRMAARQLAPELRDLIVGDWK